MNVLRVFRLLACAVMLAAPHAASAAERSLDRVTLKQLSALAPGQGLTIEGFPVGPTRVASVRFERVSIYASNAPISVESANGRSTVPHSQQVFLRGYSPDGAARVALALNPDLSVAHGNGIGPEGSFGLHVTTLSGASTLVAHKLEADLPAGFNFEYRCAGENETLSVSRQLDSVTRQLQAAVAAQATSTAVHALRFAVVAIDTDSAFMSRLFSNNTTSATNWIAGMFNTMNLMYERDLLVQLQIGTTILRTNAGSDPYAAFTPGASTSELDTFASYWENNEAGVARAFAVLLSGAISSTTNSCSASGLAWINQYCKKGTAQNLDTVGSYSVNQVCTSINIDPNGAFDAHLVGHEIGHNFGAYHTHCTNVATGSAPVATNTIDTCYNLETTLGCYSGTPSCPAAGTGTIMSYCNFTSVSGCAPNTQVLLQFHPTQIATLQTLIAGAPAGCLDVTDDIFVSLFE